MWSAISVLFILWLSLLIILCSDSSAFFLCCFIAGGIDDVSKVGVFCLSIVSLIMFFVYFLIFLHCSVLKGCISFSVQLIFS